MLFLDCGNTFIKWIFRTVDATFMLKGSCSQLFEVFEEINKYAATEPQRLVFASVRSCAENEELMAIVQGHYPSIICHEITVSKYAGGVRNGYLEAEQLGLDRWLGVIAAYNLSAQKACVVIDAGTAITIDFVDCTGQHLGGYICPGFTLMREQLKLKTRKIRYDERNAEKLLMAREQPEYPGISTLECVERGCFLMMADFIQARLKKSADLLGTDYSVYLTGGDGELFSSLLPKAKLVPELIFVGLELLAQAKVSKS